MKQKFELKETKWVIMDKDRTVIAKGSPRNRWLVKVDDLKDKKRILFYTSEAMARNGYSTGFYSHGTTGKYWRDYELEPVQVEFSIKEQHHGNN